MNIIYLCPEMLLPANTGGRIGSFKRIEYLSKNNNIYLFCVIDNEKDELYKPELEKLCNEVHLFNRKTHKLVSFLRSFIYPYACATRTFPKMKRQITEIFRNKNIDFVIVDFPQMLNNISNEIFDSGKVVLGLHNIEYITMRNLAGSITNPIKKTIFLFDSIRLQRYEKSFYSANKIMLYTFVSSTDLTFFQNTFKLNNTLLLPVGTEVIKYENNFEGKNIMFFGKMSYPANEEAICNFVANVFPIIINKIPDVKLYIVGKDPTEKVINLKTKYPDNIIVTGTVDSVEPFYKMASIVVVPLKHGGGVKVKVLEALGHCKLVITTNKGIEGTDFIGGEHLIEVSNDNDFSAKCISALIDREQYEDIRIKGFLYVKSKYTWESIINTFEKELLKHRNNNVNL